MLESENWYARLFQALRLVPHQRPSSGHLRSEESRQGEAFERALGPSGSSFSIPLKITLLQLLNCKWAEPCCDQPKRDPAASQSHRADKSVPASHAPDKWNQRAGGIRRLRTTKYCSSRCLTTHFQVRCRFGRHVIAGRQASRATGSRS